jgi:cytochrome c biogenesis protein CcmG/thiol:disulfide interchange protein DsbE
MKPIVVLAFLAVSALFSDSASPAQKTAVNKTEPPKLEQHGDSPEQMQELLVETAKTYREANSFRIERKIVDAAQSELSTISDTTLMSVVSASGNRYRIEFKNGFGWNIRQSDGQTEWDWYPWRKEYVEHLVDRSTDPEGQSPAESGFVSFLRQIDKKLASGRVQEPQTIDIGYGPVNCMVIVGPPSPRRPEPTLQEQTTYWIDKERRILVQEQYVIRSKVPEHKFESRRTTTYVTELNAAFPDSLFRFVPPNDAKQVTKVDYGGPVELVGKAAPPLKLKSLDGKDFDLGSLRGQPVLVDFWATWCMPCRESMPHLANLYDEFKGKGLALVSVSEDDDAADAARFIAKYKYSWLQIADPNKETEADWGDSGIPRLVLIGKDGKVLIESEGFDDKEEAKIRTALQNMLGASDRMR